MIKLPEPVAYLHYPPKKPELKALSWQSSPATSQTARGYVSQELVTLESAKQAVRDAYDEAAKVCDNMKRQINVNGQNGRYEECANGIRALIKEIE